MPAAPFGLLLVEGGDDEVACRNVAGSAWAGLCCWKAHGRELPSLARLAQNDPNFGYARSIGVVLDAEEDVAASLQLLATTLAVFGASPPFLHGVLSGSRPAGGFLLPDGQSTGALETLCRRAIQDARLASCVDDLVACVQNPHARRINARVAEDKGWMRAYLGMLAEPDQKLHQAFDDPQGINAGHAVFDDLRRFLQSL